ncbi:unnamed protein product [Allacma fusca]|uniref:Uncharacterized protein n=1 Tax=Allacma fusca TaxID=39272 RepID=A0A8J2JJH9_9HEXA|nr:unnamed protein product [Allacma fusca]
MEFLQVVSLVLTLSTAGLASPTSTSNNPQQGPNNQMLVHGDQKSSEQNPANQFMYRNSPGNNSPSYVPNYQQLANVPTYPRDTPSPSTFLGLSSNGEFQLSAYFSQVFWGLVGSIVGIAVIIWLIRIIFPKESFDSLVDKIKSTKTGKNMDIDRITNMVYGAIDSYSKWATKDARAGVVNPKRR